MDKFKCDTEDNNYDEDDHQDLGRLMLGNLIIKKRPRPVQQLQSASNQLGTQSASNNLGTPLKRAAYKMMEEEEKRQREIHTPVEILTERRLISAVSSGGRGSTNYKKRMSEIKSRFTIANRGPIPSSGSKIDSDSESDYSFENFLGTDQNRLRSIRIVSKKLLDQVD